MDDMATLVHAWVLRGQQGLALRQELGRQVAAVARSYPDAYFALNQKSPEAIDDLADRVFTVCSRVPKGRFPFKGREPFRACQEERFEGRDIRYHCFHARLSIARELLRGDYAQNLRRDPVLSWRAELYGEIGDRLPELATPEAGRPLRLARWTLRGQSLVLSRPDEQVLEQLRGSSDRSLPALLRLALRARGPSTQGQLSNLLAEVLQAPVLAPEPQAAEALDPVTQSAVREAVLGVWDELAPEDRALLSAIARGDRYDELMKSDPRFHNRVAITRAVGRINQRFVERLAGLLGETPEQVTAPKELLDQILEVLDTCNSLDITPMGGAE